MITVPCPHCDNELKGPDSFRGKRVRCKKCGEPFKIPVDDDIVEDVEVVEEVDVLDDVEVVEEKPRPRKPAAAVRKPSPKKAVVETDELDEIEEVEAKPKKKKRKGNLWVRMSEGQYYGRNLMLAVAVPLIGAGIGLTGPLVYIIILATTFLVGLAYLNWWYFKTMSDAVGPKRAQWGMVFAPIGMQDSITHFNRISRASAVAVLFFVCLGLGFWMNFIPFRNYVEGRKAPVVPEWVKEKEKEMAKGGNRGKHDMGRGQAGDVEDAGKPLDLSPHDMHPGERMFVKEGKIIVTLSNARREPDPDFKKMKILIDFNCVDGLFLGEGVFRVRNDKGDTATARVLGTIKKRKGTIVMDADGFFTKWITGKVSIDFLNQPGGFASDNYESVSNAIEVP